jgi:hypothetical protein
VHTANGRWWRLIVKPCFCFLGLCDHGQFEAVVRQTSVSQSPLKHRIDTLAQKRLGEFLVCLDVLANESLKLFVLGLSYLDAQSACRGRRSQILLRVVITLDQCPELRQDGR